MKEIKLFLASSYELEPDRARIGNLIRRLNDSYEKRFIHLRLIKWEDVDSFYNQVSKQQQYDGLIEQCVVFIGLFWHRAGKHTVHEAAVARKHMRPENMLIFRKTAPFRDDHEGSEDVKRFLERFPDEEKLKDSEAELGEFLKKRDTFFSYNDFSELSRVLSEKIEAYCASVEIREKEKARTYSRNTLQIHVAASPEVEPDVARLGDLVRYLDENSKNYCRIKMIDELPGSDMFVSICHTSAPYELRTEIESAIEENAKSETNGKPRLYFCMKYLGKDEKKDPSLDVLEKQFRETLTHYPDRYTHAPEMKLHFMLQLERLQRETSLSDSNLVVEKGVICQRVGQNLNPLMACGDMISLQKDVSYQKMKARLRELDAELENLKKQDAETEQDLTEKIQQCYQERSGIEERMDEKQKGYLKLARTLEEMIGQEQDELIQRVRELFQAGEIDHALDLLPKPKDQRREREERKKRHEAEDLRAYQVCSLTIDCLQAGNARKNRESIFDQYELLIDIAGDLRSEKKEANAYYDYASFLHSCGMYDKALECLDKALTVLSRVFDTNHPSFAAIYNYIGNVSCGKGEYETAMVNYVSAYSIYLMEYDDDHPTVASSYNNIANVWYREGDLDTSLEYFEKALATYLRSFGEDHPDVAACYNNIGNVWYAKGEYDKSLDYYDKALSIRLRAFGEDHPEVATGYTSIGSVLDCKGEYDKALEYDHKALAIQLRMCGEDHPEVAVSYNNIGIVWDNKGDSDKALEYHDKALSIRLRAFGGDHPEVAVSYINIGSIWSDKGEYGKALKYFDKALPILLRKFGENHPAVANIYIDIGTVFDRKDKYDKALEYYDKALAIQLRMCGEDHPEVAENYINIGGVLDSKGEYDKALEYYDKALATSLRSFGEDHPDVVSCYNGIGTVLDSKGEYHKALEYYDKALEIQLRLFGEDHPDVATSCSLKVLALQHLDCPDEEMECKRRAIAIARKFPDNIVCQAILTELSEDDKREP